MILGLLTSNEAKSLDQIDTPHNKFFIPLAWTTRLVNMARKERRIEDEFALKTLIDVSLRSIRDKNSNYIFILRYVRANYGNCQYELENYIS